MTDSEKKSNKLQTTVSDYHLFVIEGLVGIQGKSKSEILSHFIRSWIENNSIMLSTAGLTIKEWRAEEEGKKIQQKE